MSDPSLTDIPGIGDRAARILEEAGFRSVAEVASADLEALSAVKGFGPSRAASIIDAAKRLMAAAAPAGAPASPGPGPGPTGPNEDVAGDSPPDSDPQEVPESSKQDFGDEASAPAPAPSRQSKRGFSMFKQFLAALVLIALVGAALFVHHAGLDADFDATVQRQLGVLKEMVADGLPLSEPRETEPAAAKPAAEATPAPAPAPAPEPVRPTPVAAPEPVPAPAPQPDPVPIATTAAVPQPAPRPAYTAPAMPAPAARSSATPSYDAPAYGGGAYGAAQPPSVPTPQAPAAQTATRQSGAGYRYPSPYGHAVPRPYAYPMPYPPMMPAPYPFAPGYGPPRAPAAPATAADRTGG